MDLYSRRIVGWAIEDHLRTELPLATLRMAICANIQLRIEFRCGAKMKFYRRRSRAGLAVAARSGRSSRSGGRCFLIGGSGPAQCEPD